MKDSPASEIMGSTWFLHHCQARPRPPKGLTNRSKRGGLGRRSGVISAERREGVYRGQGSRPLTSETGTANSPKGAGGRLASKPGSPAFSSRASPAQAQVYSPVHPPPSGEQRQCWESNPRALWTPGRKEESCGFHLPHPQTPGPRVRLLHCGKQSGPRKTNHHLSTLGGGLCPRAFFDSPHHPIRAG